MTDVRFYHLTKSPLEKALPALVAKIYETGSHSIIKTSSQERLDQLDSLLWTFSQTIFLPHGSKKTGRAEDQPIWLTIEEDNPNSSSVLILCDQSETDQVKNYKICCEIFDGNDEIALQKSRVKWKDYKANGHDLSYWQQDEQGKWIKKQ